MPLSALCGLYSATALLLTGCAGLAPLNGPSAYSVRHPRDLANGIQVVPLTDAVVHLVIAEGDAQSFSEQFHARRSVDVPRFRYGASGDAQTFSAHFRGGGGKRPSATVGAGDVLDVTITEAPPASLFGGGGTTDASNISGASTVHATTFPEQMIGSGGTITIPFAGKIQASGRTLTQIEDDITERLKAKANQPQVLVRLVTNNADYATVIGAVSNSTRFTLATQRERVLDAVAKAGGSFEDVDKVTLQLTRGTKSESMSLGTVTRDARQNVILEPGDVVTILKNPRSFTTMGTINRSEEVNFEGTSISLIQALARAGGLNGERSNIKGIFVFRYEPKEALDWPTRPVRVSANGKVPTVYNLDLSDPQGFFIAKTFPVRDGDIVYIATAPLAELQKFLSVIGSITAPVANSSAVTANAITR